MIKRAVWLAGVLCTFAVLAIIASAKEEIAPSSTTSFTTHQTDPTGDMFGFSPQHDVTDVMLATDGVTLTVVVEFAGTIGDPKSGPNAVLGFLDFDTDQDASTGRTPHLDGPCAGHSALGIDYYIDLNTFVQS